MGIDTALLAATPSRTPGTELHWRGEGAGRMPILKDGRQGRYHQLSLGSAWVWSLCDGRRPVASIAERIAAKGGPSEIAAVIMILRRLAADGLVRSEALVLDSAPPAAHAGGLASACCRALTWRVTLRRVDPVVTWLYRHCGRFFFNRPMLGLFAILMSGGFAAFAALWLSRPNPFTGLSGGWVRLLLPLFLFGCIVLHETAHGMSTKHFGREVIGVGFGWFWLGPIFFVDTSDMWLGRRHERILVSLAGALSDLTIAGVCALVALVAGPAVSAAAFAAATVLYLRVLMNMSPLLEYDGYYILADLLNRPNLRRRSLRRVFGPSGPGRIRWREIRQHKIEWAYGGGSLVYMIFVLFMSVYWNHAFFSGLLGGAAQGWAAALTWLITLSLQLVFMFGLISDIKRLRQL
jgi:hypothetical protein